MVAPPFKPSTQEVGVGNLCEFGVSLIYIAVKAT